MKEEDQQASPRYHYTLWYAMEEHDGGTRLKLTHDAMGNLSDATRSGYTGGWDDLLNTRLAPISSAASAWASATS